MMTAAKMLAAVGDPPKSVVEALSLCMGDVQKISKDRKVTEGPARFSFRGVDDVMQAVGPALRTHGVVFAPSRVVSIEHERYTTAKGSPMDGVTVVVEYTITGPAGDTMTAAAAGQASDSGDKAVPKAMSVAFRTVLLQALCIPTDEPDPDSQVHERAADAPPDPRQAGWQSITAKGSKLGMSQADIRRQYEARNGHEIDGPEATVETLRAYYDGMTAAAPAADPWTTSAPAAEDVPLPLDGGETP